MGEMRRKFDRDFREGAVRLVRETGKPIAQIARDLGAPQEPAPCPAKTPRIGDGSRGVSERRENRCVSTCLGVRGMSAPKSQHSVPLLASEFALDTRRVQFAG